MVRVICSICAAAGSMSTSWSKYLGPGPLVAAAFIGPGTVTVCSIAGVSYGYGLLWALVLSIVTTVVLQEMSSRIGLITQKGLTTSIGKHVQPIALKYFSLTLVLLAIVIGNAAYEAGNISGGALGVSVFFELEPVIFANLTIMPVHLVIGTLALALLFSGNYKVLTGFLTVLVIVMSAAFMITAFLVRPDISLIRQGLIPSVSNHQIMTVVALIGTTVVPYNLFLHSGMVSKRWQHPTDLKYVRVDTFLSVVLGGLVSMAIIITGAAGGADDIQSAVDLAKSLEPLLGGNFAKHFMAFGLMGAGLTSAITAPLAAGHVITETFGWDNDLKSTPMRLSILFVLGLGLLFASLGIKPVQLIMLAQLANGMLLPLISGYVIWLANKSSVMGVYTNSWWMNVISVFIWIFTFGLGLFSVVKVWDMI